MAASDSVPGPGAAADGPPGVRKLYRSTDSRMLGGVAGGLAAHLGLPVLWVRMAFVVLVFGDGLGVLLYAAFWIVVPLGMSSDTARIRPVPPYATGRPLPQQGFPRHLRRFRAALQETLRGEPAAESAVPGPRRPMVTADQRGPLLALVALVAGLLVLLNTLHLRIDPYLWPLLVTGLGVALVWRQADDSRWSRWLSLGGSRRSSAVLRVVAGVALVAAGILGFLLLQGSLRDFAQVAEAVLAVLAGVLVLAGPYLLRMWQDLSTERRERIRAQERAEVAAHVHDSVLHTLTLIQRNADDAKEVVRLARAQERELREWLYRPEAAEDDTPATVADSVRAVAAEVEDAHGVPVEVVCVGDRPMDDRVGAQLQAAREAMVNAAKYGGGGPVQVYAEVEDRTVWIYVRDRGPGFDLDAVPEDRMGVRESIIGRMKRNGGTARVRPAPDGGTEVELQMERADG